MIGRPVLRAEESIAEGVELKDIMCGDEAAAVRHSLECSYPVENGIVKVGVGVGPFCCVLCDWGRHVQLWGLDVIQCR